MPMIQVLRTALPYEFCQVVPVEDSSRRRKRSMEEFLEAVEKVCRLDSVSEFECGEDTLFYPGGAKRKLRRFQ